MNDWLSICCTAEPLYEVYEENEADPIGLCGKCREHTTFEQEKEESIGIKCEKCQIEAKVTLNGVPYCVKCYKSAKRSKNEPINRRNKK